MRIAFTSSDGATIDQHFGRTRDFHVWEVLAESAAFVGAVSAVTRSEDAPEGPAGNRGIAAGSDLGEDETAARANAIASCAIVCTVQIGGPAAAKLVSRRIHPMKVSADVPIAEVIAKLQQVLRGTPPPWLRKAMNETREEG